MDGFAPLAFGTILDWSALTGIVPDAGEWEGLMALDAVIRHPEEDTASAPAEAKAESRPAPAWPTTKREVGHG